MIASRAEGLFFRAFVGAGSVAGALLSLAIAFAACGPAAAGAPKAPASGTVAASLSDAASPSSDGASDSDSIASDRAATDVSARADGGASTVGATASNADGGSASCGALDPAVLAPVAFSTKIVKTPVPQIEGDSAALAPFYEKLARIARGAKSDKTRLAFYGDSNMTRDVISGAFRRVLQTRFGDGGHGFVAAARAWIWYEHMDVRHDATPPEAWTTFAASGRPLGDKMYGAGSIAAEATQSNASSWVATSGNPQAPVGRTATRAEVFYLARPLGGSFNLEVDGHIVQPVSTQAEQKELRFTSVSFPEGPHKIESVVRGGRSVRLYGTALERDAGVVIDSLGAGALNFELLAHVEKTTRVAMLRERNYDVVIFLLGTNLLGAASQRKWITPVLDDVREALPNAAIVIMSAPDQGIKPASTVSNPAVESLAKQLRETALAEHVLFWDFYAAMGGRGAVRAFVQSGLGEPDCVHLGMAGASLMGTRFASEVMRGFSAYVAEHPSAGCAANLPPGAQGGPPGAQGGPPGRERGSPGRERGPPGR